MINKETEVEVAKSSYNESYDELKSFVTKLNKVTYDLTIMQIDHSESKFDNTDLKNKLAERIHKLNAIKSFAFAIKSEYQSALNDFEQVTFTNKFVEMEQELNTLKVENTLLNDKTRSVKRMQIIKSKELDFNKNDFAKEREVLT